jgi:hypothetical protein
MVRRSVWPQALQEISFWVTKVRRGRSIGEVRRNKEGIPGLLENGTRDGVTMFKDFTAAQKSALAG